MKSALYSRRNLRSTSINRSIVSTISFVGTILDYRPRFKMGLPDAYANLPEGSKEFVMNSLS